MKNILKVALLVVAAAGSQAQAVPFAAAKAKVSDVAANVAARTKTAASYSADRARAGCAYTSEKTKVAGAHVGRNINAYTAGTGCAIALGDFGYNLYKNWEKAENGFLSTLKLNLKKYVQGVKAASKKRKAALGVAVALVAGSASHKGYTHFNMTDKLKRAGQTTSTKLKAAGSWVKAKFAKGDCEGNCAECS